MVRSTARICAILACAAGCSSGGAEDTPCVVGQSCTIDGVDPRLETCMGTGGTEDGNPICVCECTSSEGAPVDGAAASLPDGAVARPVVSIDVPVDDAGVVPALSIAAGLFFTCVRVQDGSVDCWGYNEYGTLGSGLELTSGGVGPVSGVTGSLAVGANGYDGCVVAGDKTVQCWGDNFGGQLGELNLATSPVPVPVPGVSDVVQLSVGGADSDCVLHSHGTVECWGSNTDGQLGNGILGGTPYFMDPPGPVDGLGGAVAISVGFDHACALMQDTTVQCWGNVLYANLAVDASVASPLPVARPGTLQREGGGGWTGSTCALSSDGTVSCWGENAYGEVGNGVVGTAQPTPVTVPGLNGVTSIAAGAGYVCAVLGNGTAACWGSNQQGLGVLGNGTTMDSPTPVPVSGLTNVAGIAPGTDHACAQMTDGTFACWGDNQYGQLGDGTTTSSLVPVKVTVTMP